MIYQDKKWYENRIQSERELEFKYIDNIVDSLIYYESNRDKYKTFAEFYPSIIDNIKSYKLENSREL